MSRNVNTESLYGTNSFFRKDGRLDIVEELMEFSAKRKINTTCISCGGQTFEGATKRTLENKNGREREAITSRNAPPSFGGALRDVQKTAAGETKPRGAPF